MDSPSKTYLALGDSMSIDDYTGVAGGGAVNQFFRSLGDGWMLDDRTFDGCQMSGVPTDGRGDVITLTIGGNDLLWNKEQYLAQGLAGFEREHLALLRALRNANPESTLIVGDIYHPDAVLSEREHEAFLAANRVIAANCLKVTARLAPIHATFRGREQEFLCMQIEPNLHGAQAITDLFRAAFEASAR